MSFASTPSGFGNTSNTNQFGQKSLFGGSQPATTNIFGQQAATGQPAGQQSTGQTTNLFGQPVASTQPTPNLFGQQSTTSQPAATSNLFGTTQSTPNLFGQQAGQSTTTQPTTSLFGQQAGPSTTQPTANLFGQQTGQSTNTQPTTNLFGQQSGQSTTTQPTTSLFGQPAAQPTTNIFSQSKQPPAFGQSTTGTGTQTSNIFGQNSLGQSQQQQQPSQGTTNLFGGSNVFGNTQTQSNPFGTNNPVTAQPTLPVNALNSSTTGNTNLFSGFQRQPQQQQPLGSTSQANGTPPFTKSTKFNDLPDEVKKTFEQIESFIQGRVQISKDLQSRKLGQEATKGQDLVRTIHQEYVNTANTIKSDLHFTQDLKEKVNQAVQDTIIATRIVDGFKNPQTNGSYLKDHATFPLEYFTRVTEQIKQKLAWYQSTVEQIERKLSSLNNQAQYTPQGIAATLQAQHATFLALAGKTAQLDAELQKIKTLYTQLWRAKTGSVRDPFNALDMDQSSPSLGMSAMQIR